MISKCGNGKAVLTLTCSVHTPFSSVPLFVRNHPEIHWWEEEQKLSKLWGTGVRYNIRSCQKENQWSEKSSGFMGRHCAQIAHRIIIYLLFTAVSDSALLPWNIRRLFFFTAGCCGHAPKCKGKTCVLCFCSSAGDMLCDVKVPPSRREHPDDVIPREASETVAFFFAF